MRRTLLLLTITCAAWGSAWSASAKAKPHPPEKITGQKLATLDLPQEKTDCSGPNSKDVKLCKVTSYNYLNEEVSPDGKKWGKVDSSALVLQTIGKKDLVLSAGVNWSIKGDAETPIKERFQYLSKELEKNFGAPTSTTPPAMGPTAQFQEGLQEYLQFSNENLSATLILRKKGEGTKQKISVSVTFTDQSLYQKQQTSK